MKLPLSQLCEVLSSPHTMAESGGIAIGKARLVPAIDGQKTVSVIDLQNIMAEAEAEEPTQEASPVNLYEVSAQDWTNLQDIQNGKTDVSEEDKAWLKACGLVEFQGTSVVLTRLAQEWLSSPQ